MGTEVFVYRIDADDTITRVSSNWNAFAEANGGQCHCRANEVVGKPLWDFIEDGRTQHLYQEIFRRIRRGCPSRPIPFRCDSPTERRYLELSATAKPDGSIEVTSKILCKEPRPPVKLIQTDTPRSSEKLLAICSMCKKIRVSPEHWAEIEEGLAQLKIFEAEVMPQLTHGLCPDCYQAAMAEIEDAPAAS